MSLATDWKDGLVGAIRDFGRTRRVSSPVVKATLADGDEMYLYRAEAGPGDEYVTLSPYPPGREHEMIENDDDSFTPRAIIVHVSRVAKIELLTAAVEERAVGFALPNGD